MLPAIAHFAATLAKTILLFRASARLCLTLAVLACAGLFCVAAGAPSASAEKLNLRVLYCGQPESPRAKDFVEFLRKHFTQVEEAGLDTFRESDTANFDVVLLDYDELKVVSRRIQFPKVIVSKQFTRPTVTIGATGALVCGRLGLKTGYL